MAAEVVLGLITCWSVGVFVQYKGFFQRRNRWMELNKKKKKKKNRLFSFSLHIEFASGIPGNRKLSLKYRGNRHF